MNAAIKKIKEILTNATKHFRPDIILVWETASAAIRSIFKRALIIDLMPGFMSRPPYPKMISIDPVGLYKNCWYKNFNESARDEYIQLKNKLSKFYLDFFDDINAERQLRSAYEIQNEKPFDLIPLQISDYFGFKCNCRYKNQYEYLQSIVARKSGNIYVATQYTGSFISDCVLTQDNIDYLNRLTNNNIKYREELNTIDSISQFIVPYARNVYSISSTLGLQACFYNKKIISDSISHLSYLADTEKANAVISIILSRGQFFFDIAVDNSSYFPGIIEDMYDRFCKKYTGHHLLPSSQVLKTSFANYVNYSKFKGGSINSKRSKIPGVSHHPSSFTDTTVASAPIRC